MGVWKAWGVELHVGPAEAVSHGSGFLRHPSVAGSTQRHELHMRYHSDHVARSIRGGSTARASLEIRAPGKGVEGDAEPGGTASCPTTGCTTSAATGCTTGGTTSSTACSTARCSAYRSRSSARPPQTGELNTRS